MDIKIEAGDWVNTNGTLTHIQNTEELLQHIEMRMRTKRGVFYPDAQLGSYLYTLMDKKGESTNLLALQYARQALEPMRNVLVESVTLLENKLTLVLYLQGVRKEVELNL